MKKNLIITILMLLPFLWGGVGEGYAQVWDPSIDPLDTLDEEDLEVLKNKIPKSRMNVTQYSSSYKTANAIKYIVDDRFEPKHQSFSNKSLFDNLFFGAGGGLEQIVGQSKGYEFKSMTQIGLIAGKQLSKKSTVRLVLGGGWGYQKDYENQLMRYSGRLDYLFNLSSHVSGYNPMRTVGVSLLAGVGTHFTFRKDEPKQMAPEIHFGTQVTFYTGPKGYFNIEPIFGIGTSKLQGEDKGNWRGYDIFYGITANYSFYINENLNEESRLKLLRSRLASDKMVDSKTLERWRTPWFIEYAQGFSAAKYPNMGMGETMGNETQLSVGRWLSPTVGFRLSGVVRSNYWYQETMKNETYKSSYERSYPCNYYSGRVEMLVNPLGFLKSFKWDARYGVYAVLGVEYGRFFKYAPSEHTVKTHSEAYGGGIHAWMSLSQDLQFFIEPRITSNIYSIPYSNVFARSKWQDTNYGVDMGITMMMRSHRYRDKFEFDDVQHYNHRMSYRGFRVGLAGGLAVMQRKDYDYGGGKFNWTGMANVEYGLDQIHSFRAQVELVNFSRDNNVEYIEEYIDLSGHNAQSHRKGLWSVESKRIFASLAYQANLTNLFGGKLSDRKVNLDAYIGPAISFKMSDKAVIGPYSVMHDVSNTVTPILPDNASKLRYGFNLGLKLTSHVWKGISVMVTPTIYGFLQDADEMAANSMAFGKMRFYQTLNVGVQYKVGKLRRNPSTVKKLRLERERNWRDKKAERMTKLQEKRNEKVKRMKEKYQKKWSKQN